MASARGIRRLQAATARAAGLCDNPRSCAARGANSALCFESMGGIGAVNYGPIVQGTLDRDR